MKRKVKNCCDDARDYLELYTYDGIICISVNDGEYSICYCAYCGKRLEIE